MRQKYQPHILAISRLIDQLQEDYTRDRNADARDRYFEASLLMCNLKTMILKSESDIND